MSQATRIYGHSRGYRNLTLFAIAAMGISGFQLDRGAGINPVALVGLLSFAGLFFYAWRRTTRRVVVLQIEEEGFSILDPAQPMGLIRFDEIEELRIYALLERPMVAFRLHEPHQVRRRGPAMIRLFAKPLWSLRHYPIVLQLDAWNDQVASVKSVAVKAGIPIRSELL